MTMGLLLALSWNASLLSKETGLNDFIEFDPHKTSPLAKKSFSNKTFKIKTFKTDKTFERKAVDFHKTFQIEKYRGTKPALLKSNGDNTKFLEKKSPLDAHHHYKDATKNADIYFSGKIPMTEAKENRASKNLKRYNKTFRDAAKAYRGTELRPSKRASQPNSTSSSKSESDIISESLRNSDNPAAHQISSEEIKKILNKND